MFPTTPHLNIASAMLPTPHWPIPHSTLPNPQLRVMKLSTSHCKRYIVNLPNWFHLMGCPHFFHIAPLLFIIFCPKPKIHSLVAQTRFLWDLFSTHLPSALSSYPQCYLPTSYIPNTYRPPTSYVPCTLPRLHVHIAKVHMCTSLQVYTCTFSRLHVHIDKCTSTHCQVCNFTSLLPHIDKFSSFPSLKVHKCILTSFSTMQVHIAKLYKFTNAPSMFFPLFLKVT
jgi:hypothetical protein